MRRAAEPLRWPHGLPTHVAPSFASTSQERLTAQEAMAHPYFAPVRAQEAHLRQQQQQANAQQVPPPVAQPNAAGAAS